MTSEKKLHTLKKKNQRIGKKIIRFTDSICLKNKTKQRTIGISEPMADYGDVACLLNVRVACRFKVKTAWVHIVIISYSVRSNNNGKGGVLILVNCS